MDPLIAEVTLAGFAAGIVLTATFCSVRIGQLKKRLAAREATIDTQCERITSDAKELDQLSTRCSELRAVLRDREATVAGYQAEETKRAEQRRAALAAAQQKNRERHAAKADGNVSELPPRKRA